MSKILPPFFRTYTKVITEMNLKKQLQKEKWFFNDFRFKVILDETEDWEKNYLPINIENKIILDVGAGAGETARFYLKHGAKQVICIEPNPISFTYLLKNSIYHNIIPIQSYFKLEDLYDIDYDFAKIDIEGYEELMLGHKFNKPILTEIHSVLLAEKFKKEGWKINNVSFIDEKLFSGCTRYGFWRGI